MDCGPPDSSVHGDSPGKSTGVGCHFLLQGIFPTQGLNPGLLHWQVDSSPSKPQGSPGMQKVLNKSLMTGWMHDRAAAAMGPGVSPAAVQSPLQPDLHKCRPASPPGGTRPLGAFLAHSEERQNRTAPDTPRHVIPPFQETSMVKVKEETDRTGSILKAGLQLGPDCGL